MRGAIVLAAVLMVAAAGALALNLVLLSSASARNDPVGRLVPAVRPAHAPKAAPAWIVRRADGPVEDRGADD